MAVTVSGWLFLDSISFLYITIGKDHAYICLYQNVASRCLSAMLSILWYHAILSFSKTVSILNCVCVTDRVKRMVLKTNINLKIMQCLDSVKTAQWNFTLQLHFFYQQNPKWMRVKAFMNSKETFNSTVWDDNSCPKMYVPQEKVKRNSFLWKELLLRHWAMQMNENR